METTVQVYHRDACKEIKWVTRQNVHLEMQKETIIVSFILKWYIFILSFACFAKSIMLLL